MKETVTLSPPERAVFDQLVKYAYDNDEIAHRLGSTRRTVKFHLSTLFRKFGVTSREQLILIYWKQRFGDLQRKARAS